LHYRVPVPVPTLVYRRVIADEDNEPRAEKWEKPNLTGYQLPPPWERPDED